MIRMVEQERLGPEVPESLGLMRQPWTTYLKKKKDSLLQKQRQRPPLQPDAI